MYSLASTLENTSESWRGRGKGGGERGKEERGGERIRKGIEGMRNP